MGVRFSSCPSVYTSQNFPREGSAPYLVSCADSDCGRRDVGGGGGQFAFLTYIGTCDVVDCSPSDAALVMATCTSLSRNEP